MTDNPFGRIFRIDPKGQWEEVAEWAGEPNGMKVVNEHELVITDYRNNVMLCDIASGAVRPYLERRNTERFKGVNDLIFDLLLANVPSPNGVALSPDERVPGSPEATQSGACRCWTTAAYRTRRAADRRKPGPRLPVC